MISFHALASPRRREILRVLWHGEAAAGEIHAAMPDVTFGAVSQHLKTLTGAGLVTCRREHRSRIYRVQREALGPIGEALERMWSDALWRLKLQAELDHSRRGPRPARRRTRRKPS